MLRFKKEDTVKEAESVLQIAFVFRWVVGTGDYKNGGHKYGYPVEQEKLE
jgi:hypothetical protein